MFLRTFVILVIAAQGLDAVGHKCFNCGYMRRVGGEMEKLPDINFCNDFAKPQDFVTECPDGDCCGVVREFFTKNDTDTLNSTYTQEIGRHGCESSLDKFASHYKIECPNADSKANCITFTENLPTYNDTGLVDHAEVCFCNSDRCNDQDPMIEPSTPRNGATNLIPSLPFFIIAFLSLLELYKSR